MAVYRGPSGPQEGRLSRLDDAQRLIDGFRGSDPQKRHDMSPKGWPMSREGLSVQLAARIADDRPDNFPNQGQTSRCGPAAFLYCLLENRPDLYVKFAIELWRDGRSNLRNGPAGKDFMVQPGPGTMANMSKARASLSDLDWLTMGSLSKPDHGNADPGDEMTAITLPSALRAWFEAAGSTPHVFTFDSALGASLFGGIDVTDLQKGLALYGADWIVLEIDPHLIADQSGGLFQRHWVVVSEKTLPTFGNMTLQGFDALKSRTGAKRAKVAMQFACWGRRDLRIQPNITVEQFLGDWYGVAAFPPIP